MPPVAAPADKRFRRAHVKPAGKRGLVAAAACLAAWCGPCAVLAVVVYAGWRGSGARRERHRPAGRPHHRAAATSGCRPARCSRCSTACAARTSSRVDLGRVARAPAVVALGARTRRCGASLPSHGRGRGARAHADGDRPHRQRALSGRSPRRASSTSTVRPTPTSTCRSSTAWRRRGDAQPARRGRAPPWRRASSATLSAHAGPRRPRCRRSTSPTRTTRWCMLDGDPALLRLGDERLRRAPAAVPRARRRRCASACRTIDYVDLRFDERLYVRPVARGAAQRRRRRREATAVAVETEAAWHARNDTSSGSTSARRRCAAVVGEIARRRRPRHHRHRRRPSRGASGAASSSTSRPRSSRSRRRSRRPS